MYVSRFGGTGPMFGASGAIVAPNQSEGKPVPTDDSPRSSADSPRSHAAHWLWFRRLMIWMFAFSLVVVAIAVCYMHQQGVPLRPWLLLPLGLGIMLSLMLAAGLMGLVFVSARSGIDDGVYTPPPPDSGEER
jgi:hypothetical protein